MLDEISQKNLKEALDKFVPDHCCDPGVTIKPIEPIKSDRTIFFSHTDFQNNITVNGTDIAEFIEFVNRAIPILDTMMREQNERLKNLQSASEELDKAIKALERRIEEMRPPIIMPYPTPVYPNQPTEYPPNPYAPWYDPYRPFITTTGTPIAYPVYFTCENKSNGSNAFGAEVSGARGATAELINELKKNGVR